MPTISFLFLWCWSSLVSRQKMLQPFGEMLLCSTVTPWPLGLFGSVAPTCHSGFRPAINVDDARHEMATKPTQLGTVMIFSNSCNDPCWRKIYLLATHHVTSARSYVQPLPKTSWSRLMRDQSELADAPSSVKKRCCVPYQYTSTSRSK